MKTVYRFYTEVRNTSDFVSSPCMEVRARNEPTHRNAVPVVTAVVPWPQNLTGHDLILVIPFLFNNTQVAENNHYKNPVKYRENLFSTHYL